MVQRMNKIAKKNMEFHQTMDSMKPGTQQKVCFESDKILVHPFVNEESVFFQRSDFQQNAFVELENFDSSKYPFAFDDENVTFVDVN